MNLVQLYFQGGNAKGQSADQLKAIIQVLNNLPIPQQELATVVGGEE
jgi:hypothetical protein